MVVLSVQDLRAQKSIRPLPRFYRIDPKRKKRIESLRRLNRVLIRVRKLLRLPRGRIGQRLEPSLTVTFR